MGLTLEIEKLNKRYGSNHALKDFSYTLTEGVYALLGPNGSGKSTLMNIITDNLLADSGKITYKGEDVKRLGVDFLRVIGYMPQQQGLYDTFTASRFMYYMAALKGLTKSQADEQIPDLFKLVNLQDVANKRLGSFSGGMKQRILIAQAILGQPELLILDEPTAGLDPKERIRIRNLISQISFNKIVLIATHVVSDIEYIAKDVILLKKGSIADSGHPHTLSEKLKDSVYVIKTSPESLPDLEDKYRVGNISKDRDSIYVRVVSDHPPKGYDYEMAKPTLEDLYLWMFDQGEAL